MDEQILSKIIYSYHVKVFSNVSNDNEVDKEKIQEIVKDFLKNNEVEIKDIMNIKGGIF